MKLRKSGPQIVGEFVGSITFWGKTMKRILILVSWFLASSSVATAAQVTYTFNLSGANEATPNASPALGFGSVVFDLDFQTMRVTASFADLTAANTAAHIHCCTGIANGGTAIVATVMPTFTDFPSGVTSGTYDHTFDLNSAGTYNSSFVTAQGGGVDGAKVALLAGAAAGQAYFNIHTSTFPGGEIRGFLLTPVPLPAGIWLFGSGLGLWVLRLRQRHI